MAQPSGPAVTGSDPDAAAPEPRRSRGTTSGPAIRLCYVTAGDRNEALRIGRALVEERLAACANVIDGMVSVFEWAGKVEQADEAVLILKTTDDLVPKLVERVKALHGYDCPCVIALPVEGGNPAFLGWIAGAVGGA